MTNIPSYIMVPLQSWYHIILFANSNYLLVVPKDYSFGIIIFNSKMIYIICALIPRLLYRDQPKCAHSELSVGNHCTLLNSTYKTICNLTFYNVFKYVESNRDLCNPTVRLYLYYWFYPLWLCFLLEQEENPLQKNYSSRML